MFRGSLFVSSLVRRCAVVSATAAVSVAGAVAYQKQTGRGLFSHAYCEAPPSAPPAANSYVPDLNEYELINEASYMKDFDLLRAHHVLYSSLSGEDKVERYEVYRHKHKEEIYCIVEFGKSITGWPNIVHGGVSALLLDNTFGWVLFAFKKPVSVTAYLNINYRSPVYANSTSILRVNVDKQEGKKLFMSGTLTKAGTDLVQVEAKSLFVAIKN